MKSFKFFLPALLLFCLAATLPAVAQVSSEPTLVPADARFAVVLNPSKVYQSRLGQTILERIRVENPQVDEVIDMLCETAGIDLRQNLGLTVLYGTGYDRDSIALVADIGPSSGNLNGLLLTAPGYDSEVYRESVIVHSVPDKKDPENVRIYCATPKRAATGSYYVVASFDPDRTRALIDQTMDGSARLMPLGADGSTLVEAWFNSLPELARVAKADGPPSALAELILDGRLSVREEGENVKSVLRLNMIDNLRAQQVFELMRGGLAAVQLAATAEPEAKPLADLAMKVRVEHAPDRADVVASFDCTHAELQRFLDELSGM